MKKKIFILGLIYGPDSLVSEFEELEKIISSKNEIAITPQSLFEGSDMIMDTMFCYKKILSKILSCDAVVTLNNWDNDLWNLKLVNIARQFEIDIIPFTKYLPASNEKKSTNH